MKNKTDEGLLLEQLDELACRGSALAERSPYRLISWFFAMAKHELRRLVGQKEPLH